MICSPFLLAAIIKFHLQKEGTPLALHILKNIYVYNVIISVYSHSEICGVYKEAKSIFGKAAMNLCKRNSNSFKSLEFIRSCEKSTVRDATNVLGLLWNQFEDKICFKGFDEVITSVVTKHVLHSVAKIFDPLGLVSPVTFHGKVFLKNRRLFMYHGMTPCLWSFSRNGKKLANHLQRSLV